MYMSCDDVGSVRPSVMVAHHHGNPHHGPCSRPCHTYMHSRRGHLISHILPHTTHIHFLSSFSHIKVQYTPYFSCLQRVGRRRGGEAGEGASLVSSVNFPRSDRIMLEGANVYPRAIVVVVSIPCLHHMRCSTMRPSWRSCLGYYPHPQSQLVG